MRLQDKVAIVTGAASGMGAATAKLFAAEGAKVVLTDILEEEGTALADEIGGAARFHRLDVTSETDWDALVAETLSAFGRVDILINNAGVSGSHPDVLNTETWDEQINVNARGVFLGMRAVIPKMQEAGGGSIVNISSVASSVIGAPNRFIYGASKAAVIGLTKSIASDFVTRGLRCNAICPGTVESPSLEDRLSNTGDYDAARTAFIARQPMGRFGTAEEIASLAVYLASDESAFVTGQAINIDGGWTG